MGLKYEPTSEPLVHFVKWFTSHRLAQFGLPGNLPVVDLVTQDEIWGSGNDDVGLIQSTKAPKHHQVMRFGSLAKDEPTASASASENVDNSPSKVACTLHPTPHTLHPAPYIPHPAPYTLHNTPYALRPTPYTIRPTPYTLHPTPYTLHPTPCTLKSAP